jgi:hypothetical protein
MASVMKHVYHFIPTDLHMRFLFDDISVLFYNARRDSQQVLFLFKLLGKANGLQLNFSKA